jgi:hypothetical protein
MGANTHSADFEKANEEYAYRAGASCVGLNFTQDFTIEAWIKRRTGSGNDDYTICMKGNEPSTIQWYFGFLRHATAGLNKLYVVYSTNGSSLITASSSQQIIPENEWHHIAVSRKYSNGLFRFYYDGNPIGTEDDPDNLTLYTGTGNFQIGRTNSYPEHWMDGAIDELRIWNDIRSESEIDTNKDVQLTGSESGLVAYYQFNNTWNDLTSNGNHVTPEGAGSEVPEFITDVPFVGGPGAALLIGLQAEEQMAKTQFASGEDLIITFPPFIDKTTGERIVGTDVATLVVKKPDDTLMGTPPTASFDSDIDMWRATIPYASFEEGEWLVKATTNDSDGLDQYISYTWGDYVDDILEARQAAIGRWKIDGTQLKLYEDDGSTVFKTYDLKDSDGNPSSTRIFERDPV